MVSLVEDMLSNRQFRVFVEDKSSKFRFLNNGLPQGLVFSPILFNLYTNDLPPTNSRKFIYADDLAMAYQHQNFENVENGLSDDLIPLNKYFTKWRLCPNPQKTEVCCFHLVNNQKNRKLKVVFNETTIKHNYSPTYLGVTLDSSLTFKLHIEKLQQKLKTRNNIIHKLAGTSWGANVHTLRVTGLALVYSTAEYCCPAWKNSAHVNKVDAQLNTTLRIITGTLKSTPTPWLHVLAHIIPYDIRRKYLTKRIWDKFQNSLNMYSITQDMANLPLFRLKSRKPLWKEEFLMQPFYKSDYWKAAWQEVFNKNLIKDPTKQIPGFDLPRKINT
jgi:hypothetical protein